MTALRPTIARAALALALMAGAAGSGGCGLSLLPHRGVQAPRAAAAEPKPDAKRAAKAAKRAHAPAPSSVSADAPRAKGAPRDVADLRERMAAEPAEPYWPWALAARHVAADSLALAERELRQALARDPDHAPSLALLSRLWFASQRHAEALEMLEAARTRAAQRGVPFEPVLLAAIALHDEAVGRTAEAHEALAAAPASAADALAPVAAYLALRGTASTDSAAALVREAVHADGRSAANRNNEGLVKLRAGDVEGARRALLAAIERDPQLPGPYYNLAILEKFYVFDDEAAARWFRLYRDRATDDPDGLAQVFPASPAEKGGR